jgi:RNA polymerase sigma factor (sigma-70 family)
MHSPGLSTAVHRIRSLTAPPSDDLADAELLRRFRKSNDESAFSTIVARHGPAVFGVCQRVLNNRHDAEDAFQATFLVFARRAGSIQKTGALGCWLHGVAHRVANKSRVRLAKLPRPTALPDISIEPHEDVSWREVRRILDEEVNRLPERLRLPVLLCYFEGKTRDEAAAVLGWKLTTLRGRLEDGRLRLRARLAKRGIELSAALLAISAASEGSAIDHVLAESTLQTLAGQTTDAVKSLAKGIAMTGAIGKTIASIGALILIAGLGVTLLAFRGQAGDAPGTGFKSPGPPAKSSDLPGDLLALFQAADRVWVVDEPTDKLPIPEPGEVLKGMSPPEKGYSFKFNAEALKQLPRKGNRWIVFLKSIDEVDHIPKVEPIAGERWCVPADDKTVQILRAHVPPCEWGDESNGLRVGLWANNDREEPTVEVVLQNVSNKDIRFVQFRGNYFDDWKYLNFAVTAPDGKLYSLERIGGAHKDSDAPNDRVLKAGERHVQVVRLNRWLKIPDHGRGTMGNAPAGLFAAGGEFKIEASYSINFVDNPIRRPWWVGTIHSKSVSLTAPKLGLFGEPAGDFRLRLRQPPGTLQIGAVPELVCDLQFIGKEKRSVFNLPENAAVELDGHWYTSHRDGAFGGNVQELAPASEHAAWLAVKPDSQWIHLRDNPNADDPAIKEAIPFRLATGKHTVRIAYAFSKTERAVSNAVTIDVASDGWGEPTDGIKARLRMTKTKYGPGDPLVFDIDLKNTIRKDRLLVPVPFNCMVEVDNRWYIFHGDIDYKSAAKELKPGGELVPFVSVTADDRWKSPRWDSEKGGLKEGDPAFNFLPLKLTPGKHNVRVSISIEAGQSGPTTNKVEIEVDALDPVVKAMALNADRIWIVNAPTRAKPVPVAEQVLKGPIAPEQSLFDLRLLPGDDPKKKFIVFVKSEDDGIKVPEPKPWPTAKWYLPYTKEMADGIRSVGLPERWGEEKSGLRMGLRLREPTVGVGKPVVAEIVMHNNGKTDWSLTQFRFNIYDYWPDSWFDVIAPDGQKWQLRKHVGKISEADSPSVITLKPGESYVQTVQLDTWPAHTDWNKLSEPVPNLFTKPGEYTITGHHRYSPPMGFGTWTAGFATGSEKLILKEVDGWGEESGGIKSRVRLSKAKFVAGEPLEFALDLKNAGDKTVDDYPIGQMCNIDLDGTTYFYTAPLGVPTSLVKLEPGKEYASHVKVTTNEWWQDNKGNRLTLTLGKHKMSVSYPLPGRGADRVISPAIEFEVAAEKK